MPESTLIPQPPNPAVADLIKNMLPLDKQPTVAPPIAQQSATVAPQQVVQAAAPQIPQQSSDGLDWAAAQTKLDAYKTKMMSYSNTPGMNPFMFLQQNAEYQRLINIKLPGTQEDFVAISKLDMTESPLAEKCRFGE